MNKITKIVASKKKETFILFLENQKQICVHEDLLVRFQLTKGKTLSDNEIQQLESEVEFHKGFQLALHYIDFQMRSQLEVENHLLRKGVPKEKIPTILEKLTEMKWVNDEQFAKQFVSSQMRIGNKGKFHLKQQLKTKGIQDEWIENALEEISLEEENELALKVATTALKQYRKFSAKEKQHKIKTNLANKGFSSENIQFALQELTIEKDEEFEWELLVHEAEKMWKREKTNDPYTKRMKVAQKLYQKGFESRKIKEAIQLTEEDHEE